MTAKTAYPLTAERVETIFVVDIPWDQVQEYRQAPARQALAQINKQLHTSE